jgi:hypothetical protein
LSKLYYSIGETYSDMGDDASAIRYFQLVPIS